ncbi:MAG: hypothetical protein GC190_03095 [Alphaproteobacteria bacterium]|nr:hypothetical protein [Alphaproteobacteria bacterium]
MDRKNRDPQIAALEAIHAALKDLDADSQKKVLSSVFALLDIHAPAGSSTTPNQSMATPQAALTSRPTSLIELMQQKSPGTNAQRIALFAYYRERVEGLSRFERDDLKGYFPKAKEPPAGNYDRDFVEAVKKGWIHEDGADSYLTSKGVEAVESGFEGERKVTKKPRKSSLKSRPKRKG